MAGEVDATSSAVRLCRSAGVERENDGPTSAGYMVGGWGARDRAGSLDRERSHLTADATCAGEFSVNELQLWLIRVVWRFDCKPSDGLALVSVEYEVGRKLRNEPVECSRLDHAIRR
jgi:hypothetical protein